MLVFINIKFFFSVKPISVKIRNKPTKLKAETPCTVICETVGSRPPAQVNWYRDNRRFRHGKVNATET